MGSTTPKKGRAAAEGKGPSECHLPLRSTPTQPAEYSTSLWVFCKPGKEPTPHQSSLHLFWVHGNKLRKGRPETQGKAHYPNTAEALGRGHRSKEKRGPTRHWEAWPVIPKSILISLRSFLTGPCSSAVQRDCS